jgi:hypothetical protein
MTNPDKKKNAKILKDDEFEGWGSGEKEVEV